MTTTSLAPGRQLPVVVTSPLAVWVEDGWTVTKRNLIKLKRSPDMLVFAVLRATRVYTWFVSLATPGSLVHLNRLPR